MMAAAIAAAACGDGSPVAPTGPPPGSTDPPPAAVTLKGRVRESAPTQTAGVEGAVVRVADGTKSAAAAITDRYGFYTLAGVTPGMVTIEVTADGFVTASERVAVSAGATADFYLTPVQRTMSHTSTETIASTDGTCSDGISMKPCRILTVPVHNAGTATASLTWTGSGDADLDLTLFQTGVPTPIARSSGPGTDGERITAALQGSATYEFRVTWAGGTGTARYVLDVTYPY